MPFVYLLSEDDSDDQIYVYILEMLIGVYVTQGFAASAARRWCGGRAPGCCHFSSLTSDEADNRTTLGFSWFWTTTAPLSTPSHEAQPHSRDEACRHCGLTAALHAAMPDGWPIPGARGGSRADDRDVAAPDARPRRSMSADPALPVCRSSDMASARALYGPNPPPQLKDLVEIERRASRATSKEEFALACVLKLDPNDLAQRSPSFRRFRDDVSKWPVG